MEALVTFVFTLILVGLVVGVLIWAVKSLPLIPEPIKQIIVVLLVVIGVFWIIGSVTGYFPSYHFHRYN